MPTTPPVRNAIFAPLSRPPGSLAAAATRMLACVARFMPSAPIDMENSAPTTKATERPISSPVLLAGSAKSTRKTTMMNGASVLNWRVRKALAPSWTARPMSRIPCVPSSAASTCLRRTKPMASAMTATAATTMTTMLSPAENDDPRGEDGRLHPASRLAPTRTTRRARPRGGCGA